jgi:glycogen operon protein
MPTLSPGRPYPLGATPRPEGVNFAVASEHAQFVELCLFDESGHTETARHRLPACTDGVWHGLLPGARAGLLYGFRAHGPYLPQAGHRFNPHKLLLDPYAREIDGRFEWRDEHFGFRRGHADGDTSFDDRDNAAWALKARVASPLPPIAARADPRPADEVVLYELHVKGFTRLHPGVPAELRGTYAGLAHPAATGHLRRLGVTTLSLLPVHYALTEERLARLGLVNYWGYNTIGFFCPDPRLSTTPHDSAAARREFRAMAEALHDAGLELVIDVVFNHTAEGNEHGPTLSMRGLDNAMWYRLAAEDRSRYDNSTGCGNTVDVHHPRVTQFVLDCLRYWVEEMGVDGFRFDLAPVLGRTAQGFDPRAPLFAALAQDPVLARARLIAEPWDVGYGGYQLGRFPGRWLEWNDRFRDGMRQFWLTRSADRAEFARRLLASSDRFHHGTRSPLASVNHVVAHDGFTLRDLLSYRHKHNEANGEANSDGHGANYSVNCGVEGPSDDAAVNAERGRLARALLATVLLAQGTPMLAAGDELGHSQLGNNNAYCQDNTVSWIDWPAADAALAGFVARLAALRRELPALRQPRWLTDAPRADGQRDVDWRDAGGHEMSVARWHDAARRCLTATIAPEGAEPVLLIFNAETRPCDCVLPAGRWRCVLDSARPAARGSGTLAGVIEAPAQSVLVLRPAE